MGPREGVVTLLYTIPLVHAPVILNGAKLRVEIWQQVHYMGRSFKELLEHRRLGLEVGLIREHVDGTAVERGLHHVLPLVLPCCTVLGQAKRHLAPLVLEGLEVFWHAVVVLHLLGRPDAAGVEPAVLKHRCVLAPVLHIEQLGVGPVQRPLFVVHAVVEHKDARDVQMERVKGRERHGVYLVHEVVAPPPPVVDDTRCNLVW